jgi:hypothetical protein
MVPQHLSVAVRETELTAQIAFDGGLVQSPGCGAAKGQRRSPGCVVRVEWAMRDVLDRLPADQ